MVHVAHRHCRLFQDAISVTIPLEVTADMGIAMSRSRTKRIQKLYEAFPSLQKAKEQPNDENKSPDSQNENDDSDEKDQDKQQPLPKKKRNNHMPQRHEFASVLDYLEAKYAQGVMVEQEEELPNDEKVDSEDDDDLEKRSVYSEDSSFLDDSALKRNVVGQVLSQSIQTKVEQDDEDDFFVNVGNLEVLNEEMMEYDFTKEESLLKKEAAKKKKSTTKKKTSVEKKKTNNKRSSSGDSKALASPKKKKKANDTNDAKSPVKKDKPTLTLEQQAEADSLEKIAQEIQKTVQSLHDQLVTAIKSMTEQELPRKRKNVKLSITVPAGKTGGDSILFSNPHVPGQRLKATAPTKSGPGDKFLVSVPAPPPPDDADNKFDRSFQDLLDRYSAAHDEWAQAQGRFMTRLEQEFHPHYERMHKFDSLLTEFPPNLVVAVDASYLRKVVRRARQNKHKRKKTIEKFHDENDKETHNHSKMMTIPGKGTSFEKMEFNQNDFEKRES